jgi:uncharacterized protein YjiS (DUF1127 family)
MQYDTTGAATLPPLHIPTRATSASAGGWLAQLWQRSTGCFARFRAAHQLSARDEHLLRDIGLTRGDAARAIESRHVSRVSAGWGWDMGH